MDTTATTMVVLTSAEEQAERETWIRRFAQRYAGVHGAHVPPAEGHDAVRERCAQPVADPQLREMARDFRQALAILGVDVPPPPPGTCPLCGKAKSLHEISGDAGPCQPCLRRLSRSARQGRQEPT
jgi:hypothetical protein